MKNIDILKVHEEMVKLFSQCSIEKAKTFMIVKKRKKKKELILIPQGKFEISLLKIVKRNEKR